MSIHFHIYDSEELRRQWIGYIEPDDRSWTLFIPADSGEPFLLLAAL
jgi:hypothetical protein